MRYFFLILSATFVQLISFQSQAVTLSCGFIHPIKKTMLKRHIKFNDYSSNIEARTIDQYIKTLDGSKLYLLKSDVATIKNLLKGFYKRIESRGDCQPIEQVQQLYVKRVKERYEYAKKFLDDKYKFDKEVKILLDSTKREYPKDVAEADKYQTDYIHFQIASFLATDTKIDEAKKMVVKRYERALKRIEEQKAQELYAEYLDAFAHALDPHSSYFSQEKLEEFQIQMRLSLEGIGATLSSQDGYTVIEQLIKGGAAESSGLLEVQDKIMAVGQNETGDYELIIDMPLNEVVRLIRGPKGTKVRLKILRQKGGETEKLEVTLVRRKINLEDEAAKIRYVDQEVKGKKKKIGILELPSFYYDGSEKGRSCYNDVRNLLSEAESKKVDGLVLDFSQNGGGSLEEAVKLAGLFFKKGNVVKTRGGMQADVLADTDPTVNYAGPLVILTSRFSASASEIVAGALKDYKRAVVVGADHTFGKGSVQSVVELDRSARLGAPKITIGMFFIPGGDSTQHKGVEADVVLPSVYSQDEIGEKSLDYSLPPKTIQSFVSQEAYVNSGKDRWIPVDKNVVKELQGRSKERVTKSKDFDKVREEIKKSQKNEKEIFLADVLKEKDSKKEKEEEAKRKKRDPNFREQEYMERADVKEAVSVVLDLVELQNPNNVVAGAVKSDEG
jgi:carboxyl-terminal processing protease